MAVVRVPDPRLEVKAIRQDFVLSVAKAAKGISGIENESQRNALHAVVGWSAHAAFDVRPEDGVRQNGPSIPHSFDAIVHGKLSSPLVKRMITTGKRRLSELADDDVITTDELRTRAADMAIDKPVAGTRSRAHVDFTRVATEISDFLEGLPARDFANEKALQHVKPGQQIPMRLPTP